MTFANALTGTDLLACIGFGAVVFLIILVINLAVSVWGKRDQTHPADDETAIKKLKKKLKRIGVRLEATIAETKKHCGHLKHIDGSLKQLDDFNGGTMERVQKLLAAVFGPQGQVQQVEQHDLRNPEGNSPTLYVIKTPDDTFLSIAICPEQAVALLNQALPGHGWEPDDIKIIGSLALDHVEVFRVGFDNDLLKLTRVEG